MKKLQVAIIVLLAFLAGMIIGALVSIHVISETIHGVLSAYGYEPSHLIDECLARHGFT